MSGKGDGDNPSSNPFEQWVDLAQPRIGSEVVFATDDFFADKSRLIDPAEPVFLADKFDDNGKWMDGWESRRKRTPGYDYCIVRLGVPGVVKGIELDTTHFTGNYPPAASIDACISAASIPGDDAQWSEIVVKTNLEGDSHAYAEVDDERQFTHMRLNIYPDGGVARMRVYGEIQPNWTEMRRDSLIDLLALENGGKALLCNDEHFGTMRNLNAPGRGANMGDGWETARRRVPGNDWVILALGHPGDIRKVIVDTAHFKGNYPDRAELRAALITDEGNLDSASMDWPVVLPESKLDMDTQHLFTDQLQDVGAVSHVRLNIFPDGGISRVRLFGKIATDSSTS